MSQDLSQKLYNFRFNIFVRKTYPIIGEKLNGFFLFLKMQGIDCKFQVLNDHAPLISALSKGEIKIEEESGEQKSFAINSGLVELAKNEIHILAQ